MRSANVRGKVKIKIGERPVLFLEVEIDNAVGECPGKGQNGNWRASCVVFIGQIDNAVGECSGEGQNKNSRAFPLILGVEWTIPIGKQPEKHPPKK